MPCGLIYLEAFDVDKFNLPNKLKFCKLVNHCHDQLLNNLPNNLKKLNVIIYDNVINNLSHNLDILEIVFNGKIIPDIIFPKKIIKLSIYNSVGYDSTFNSFNFNELILPQKLIYFKFIDVGYNGNCLTHANKILTFNNKLPNSIEILIITYFKKITLLILPNKLKKLIIKDYTGFTQINGISRCIYTLNSIHINTHKKIIKKHPIKNLKLVPYDTISYPHKGYTYYNYDELIYMEYVLNIIKKL